MRLYDIVIYGMDVSAAALIRSPCVKNMIEQKALLVRKEPSCHAISHSCLKLSPITVTAVHDLEKTLTAFRFGICRYSFPYSKESLLISHDFWMVYFEAVGDCE